MVCFTYHHDVTAVQYYNILIFVIIFSVVLAVMGKCTRFFCVLCILYFNSKMSFYLLHHVLLPDTAVFWKVICSSEHTGLLNTYILQATQIIYLYFKKYFYISVLYFCSYFHINTCMWDNSTVVFCSYLTGKWDDTVMWVWPDYIVCNHI